MEIAQDQSAEMPATGNDETENVETQNDENRILDAMEDEPEVEAEASEDGEPQDAEAEEPADDGEEAFVEVEWEGKTHKLPESLKSAFMAQKDYTQKTQEVAEQRKSIEARAQQIQQHESASMEFIQHHAELASLDQQLQQYGQVDWNAWENEDPLAANSAWRQFQQIKESRGQVEQDLQQRIAHRMQSAQAELDQKLQDTVKYARENIQGWTPETEKGIEEFITGQGLSTQEVREAMNPKTIEILHFAAIGKKALAAASKPPAPPKNKVQPSRSLSSKGNPATGKSPEEMTTAEYEKHWLSRSRT